MILKNKKLLLITSLITLLPIPAGYLLRSFLPPEMSPSFLWAPALCMLAAHWLCIGLTSLDKGNQNRNRKPLSLVLWILPVTSNLCCAIMYALFLGIEFSPVVWMMVPMGLMFAAIGNYLPKTKMNSTVGIKVIWAYTSEENWNATHRLAGKLWMAGGLVIALAGFLPEIAAVTVMIVFMVLLCVVPMWYSRRFYLREYAEGKVEKASYSNTDRKIRKISLVFLAALSVFVAAIMFTGDLHYSFSDTGFTVEADWYSDYTLSYDVIESMEYREGNVDGVRVGGFGSLRLLMGFFRNEEFGNYTRYTYYDPESCIVIYTAGKPVVLSGKDPAETEYIYRWIQRAVTAARD